MPEMSAPTSVAELKEISHQARADLSESIRELSLTELHFIHADLCEAAMNLFAAMTSITNALAEVENQAKEG